MPSYSFGNTSLAKLSGVHPDLAAVFKMAIGVSAQDFAIFEGLRSDERQAALYRSGASKLLRGKHQRQADGYGHAVDAVPFIDGTLRWEWGAIYPIAAAVRFAAITLGVPLVWGGVWDRRLADLPADAEGLRQAVIEYTVRHPGPDFIDGPHYQLG